MSSLLPPNATKQEVALSESVSRVGDVPVRTRQLWNPATCPANLLPWLAWAVSVDEWNSNWSDEQKRGVIAASYSVHSTKGTPAALKSSLSALGYQLTLTEWWQTPADLDPYTFAVDIDTDGGPVAGTLFTEAIALVNQAKNTRSHLARLRIRTKSVAPVFAASVSIYGAIFEIYDNTINSTLVGTNHLHDAMNKEVPEDFS